MTTPRYSPSCAAGSQERRDASPAAWSPSSNAWIVNFNNGNANNNHRDNNAFVRAVRSVVAVPPGESQGADAVSLRSLYVAWRAARRAKRPSANQQAFNTRWIDGLLGLQASLARGAWQPRPTTCFIATRPKAREIHAPDFSDRVVHHWLVPQLEAIYEPGFIHDSYANRRGKGSHAAVRRLEQFVRQVHSGEGGGWYLQLDVHNFFNSIHRGTLWTMLKRRLQRAGVASEALATTHALLRHAPLRNGVKCRASAAELALVPPHKRLVNAAPGCGLPIGNLSSQFLANVYLDELDQFVKHTLKAKRYLRYVDDFVLVHHDRAQLEAWQGEIERFLGDTLQLRLKQEIKLLPLTSGIDFLGYVIHPTHTRVRRRVVSHARDALSAWAHGNVRDTEVQGRPEDVRAVRAIWASYQGHFRHANSAGLVADFHRRFPWLRSMTERDRSFDYRLEGKRVALGAASTKGKTTCKG